MGSFQSMKVQNETENEACEDNQHKKFCPVSEVPTLCVTSEQVVKTNRKHQYLYEYDFGELEVFPAVLFKFVQDFLFTKQ